MPGELNYILIIFKIMFTFFVGLAYQGEEIVLRFIIENSG
jgi:hypothetical protein